MTPPRIAYVLGTTAGGTGRHAAMLAQGCLRAGLSVSVFGPQGTRQLFSPGSPPAAGDPEAKAGAARGPAGVAGPLAGATGRAAGQAGEGTAGEPAAGEPAAGEGAAGERAAPPAVIAFEPVDISDRPRPARDAAAVARLRRLLALAGPDVVHAHGLRAGAVAALALAGDRARAPALIVTVHNAPRTPPWQWCPRRCSRRPAPGRSGGHGQTWARAEGRSCWQSAG